MRLGNEDTMQGIGCSGGCHGTDGQLYQWVQGVDGLGNTVGCWRPASRQAPIAPYVRSSAPFLGNVAEGADGQLYEWVQGVDGLGNSFGFWRVLKRGLRSLARRALPFAQKIAPFIPGGSAALTVAAPILKQVGVSGPDGLGALYEAPDGTMYQVQGVDAGNELDGLADDELHGLSEDELHGLAAEELNGIDAGDELDGLADDELNGFADDELNGFGAEDDLRGFAAGDEHVDGIAADELDGIGAEDDLHGFAAADEINGVGEDERTMSGYVRDQGMSGVDGFIPDRPRETPTFSPSPHAPMWAPLW